MPGYTETSCFVSLIGFLSIYLVPEFGLDAVALFAPSGSAVVTLLCVCIDTRIEISLGQSA